MSNTACTERQPIGKFKRFIMRIKGQQDRHRWKPYRKQTRHVIYYCRRCACGVDQVKSAGPLGDGKWRNIDAPWRWEWEKASFESAKLIDT